LKLRFSVPLIFLIFLLTIPSQGSAPAWTEVNGPRIDDLRMKLKPGGEQRWAMERGDLDVATDVASPYDIWALEEDGFTETKAASLQMCYLILNLRSGPFDDMNFRKAIAHLVPKEFIVAKLGGDTTAMKLDGFMTQSFLNWYNPDVQIYQYNLTKAERILDEAGYVYNVTADRRMDPKTGQPLRDLEFLFLSGLLWPPYNEISMDILDNLWAVKIPAITTWLESHDYFHAVLYERNFDMTVLGFLWDKPHPDFLYDLFHSSQDVPGKYNLAGIRNSTLDVALETVKFSLNKTTINSASDLAQLTLTEQLPYVPIYSTYQTQFFDADTSLEGPDALKGMISSPGYGADNQWTFLNIHWDGTQIGGNLTWGLGDEPHTLNPLYAFTSVEWEVLYRVYDPLIAENPYTHKDVPWLAYDWSVDPWVAPGDVPGMNITFWLRDDIYWHDDAPFTAEDVKFSWEYIRQHQISNYLRELMWKNLVDIAVVNPYMVSAYYNITNSWVFYALSGTAAMLPKHIWQDIPDPSVFEPWKEPHPSPPADRPWLTKLLGTGPYAFENCNEAYLVNVDLHANRRYFLSQDDIQTLIAEMFHKIGDVNKDGYIDVFDLSRIGVAYGQFIGMPRYDPDADLNQDDMIDLRDLSMVTFYWGDTREEP
jgi:ABC-type transport system substrate-binding protein